jgi:hypothetical protein
MQRRFVHFERLDIDKYRQLSRSRLLSVATQFLTVRSLFPSIQDRRSSAGGRQLPLRIWLFRPVQPNGEGEGPAPDGSQFDSLLGAGSSVLNIKDPVSRRDSTSKYRDLQSHND